MSLLSVPFLRFPEILEILMICPYLKVLVGTHKVVSPFFKGKHDCKEFLVVALVVTFGH